MVARCSDGDHVLPSERVGKTPFQAGCTHVADAIDRAGLANSIHASAECFVSAFPAAPSPHESATELLFMGSRTYE